MCKRKQLSCGFHSHLTYSLDGASVAERKLLYAHSIGRVADTLTDHGVMSGLYDHWSTAESLKKKGKLPKDFKIIQGIEAYVIDPHRPWKAYGKGKKPEPQYYHLTVHFKNIEAYYYFCKLSKVAEDRAVVKFGEAKPLITFEELEGISEHITLGSGCVSAPIQKNALVGNYDLAKKMYEYLRSMVGPDNFYVEIFPHQVDYNWEKPVYQKKVLIKAGEFKPITDIKNWEGDQFGLSMPDPDPCSGALDIQKIPNQFVLELAEKYGDSVIISLDEHYTTKDEKLVQNLRLSNGKEAWRFYNEYHAQTSEEAAETLKRQIGATDYQIDKWIDNSYKFIEHFDEYRIPKQLDNVLLPTTEMVYDVKYKGKTNKEIFWELCENHGRMPDKDSEKYQEYLDRVNYELSVICDNDSNIDFLPYFFLLEDVCNYARSRDIMFCSRGSAGGCMVAYLLGITTTDPIRWKLSFERFLNPGRIAGGSWPDADLDWENRHLIIDYLKERYGDRVALISTDLKLQFKSSILDATRAILGSVPADVAKMTSRLPPLEINAHDWLYGYEDDGGHVPGFIEADDPLAREFKDFVKKYPEIWATVELCIGITKTRGVHAGGVIVAPEPVYNYIPVVNNKGEMATAYDMAGTEATGGVKFDMLGVSTLDALGIAIREIKKDFGIKLDIASLPEDPEVLEDTIHQMKLEGVFQVNTNVAKPYIHSCQPSNMKEISNLIALCRPGALDADAPNPDFKGTAAEYYALCAQGKMEPYYIHEDIKPYVSDTYGIFIYQEQLIRMGRDLCGYSEGDADILIRKGIGKKIKEKIEQFSDDLRRNLIPRGWSEQQVDSLISAVMASAKYSFNLAHSASYAVISWACLYIKHYYPVYYWKGMLTVLGSKEKNLPGLMSECGDLVKPADIVKSHPTEWSVEDGKYVRMPLSIVKGCGDKSVSDLKYFLQSSLEDIRVKVESEEAEKKSKKELS